LATVKSTASDTQAATPVAPERDSEAADRQEVDPAMPPPRPQPSTRRQPFEDVVKMYHDLEQMGKFVFMRPEAHMVRSLQAWNNLDWENAITKHRKEATDFFATVTALDEAELATLQPESQARRVREALGHALTMSDWERVVRFQNGCLNADREMDVDSHYLGQNLLDNYIFRRDFPLGVEGHVTSERHVWKFAVQQSGVNTIHHKPSSFISVSVYAAMASCTVALFGYLIYVMTKDGLWSLADTLQDPSVPTLSADIRARNKSRGTAASLLSAVSFSLGVNGALDKFGKIDPSTSTVFIGMTLGGTWGFVLDNLFGSDEGFREYVWDPRSGMDYAMGSLVTERFGRYVVTILFDMFFTVILFKLIYPKLVTAAGFTAPGREWIANGFTSALISLLTFKVYANMTRFEWAYPSGEEDVREQWISGQTMLLATIIMNMVYLVSETRSRVGEPGVNDPFIKLLMTSFAFCVLLLLQEYDALDPSNHAVDAVGNASAVRDPTNGALPLDNVCSTQAKAATGFAVFFGLAAFCLGFVIFGTSSQSLSGLRGMCCAGRPPSCSGWLSKLRKSDAPTAAMDAITVDKETAPGATSAHPTSYAITSDMDSERGTATLPCPPDAITLDIDSEHSERGRATVPSPPPSPPPPAVDAIDQVAAGGLRDRMMGQCCLFLIFYTIVTLFVIFFTLVPLRPVGQTRPDVDGFGRNWRRPCQDYDQAALSKLGLS